MATSLKSQGAGLFMSDLASPEVYTEITGIVSVQGPDGSASEIDTTALSDTAKTYSMGLPDEGTLTIEAIHDPSNTQHEALRAARAAQTLQNFSLRLSDSPQTQYNFSAFVPSFSLSAGVDDVVKASYTLRISGAVTKA